MPAYCDGNVLDLNRQLSCGRHYECLRRTNNAANFRKFALSFSAVAHHAANLFCDLCGGHTFTLLEGAEDSIACRRHVQLMTTVFPVPDVACTTTSEPARHAGRAASCTGDGVS